MPLPSVTAAGAPTEAGAGEGVATVTALGTDGPSAAVLASAVNEVLLADGTVGVRLPANWKGRKVYIGNIVASALKVYPPTGGSINAGGTDAAFSQSASKNAEYFAITDLKWRAVLSA